MISDENKSLAAKIDSAANTLLDRVTELVDGQTRDLANLTAAVSNLAAAKAKLQESSTGDPTQGGILGLAHKMIETWPNQVGVAAGLTTEKSREDD